MGHNYVKNIFMVTCPSFMDTIFNSFPNNKSMTNKELVQISLKGENAFPQRFVKSWDCVAKS